MLNININTKRRYCSAELHLGDETHSYNNIFEKVA